MPHSPKDLASPGGFARLPSSSSSINSSAERPQQKRRAGHRRTRHGKLILPRSAIVPLLLLASGKLHAAMAAPASRAQSNAVSLAVQMAQRNVLAVPSGIEKRGIAEGVQWSTVKEARVVRSDHPLPRRDVQGGNSAAAQRYEALSSMTWSSEDMAAQAVLARRSASGNAELLAPRLLQVAGTGTVVEDDDGNDTEEAFTVSHPGPPLAVPTRGGLAVAPATSARLASAALPVSSAAPLTASALPLVRLSSSLSRTAPTTSASLSRQPSSSSTVKPVKEQSASQPWTKSSKFPLYIGLIVVGGIVSIFLAIYLARACAHASVKRSEAKRATGGPNDGKFTSDAAVRPGRSLRRALTRKLASGSFARRTQEGSVLISVGPDVIAVTQRVAAEYERERACFWAAAHAHGANGGDASHIGSSSVLSDGRLRFDPRAALLAAQKRAERSMGAEQPIDVRRSSAQTIDIADWRDALAAAEGEEDGAGPKRKASMSQRLTAGLRAIQAKVQGGATAERGASGRNIKEEDDEATLAGGHEDKFGSGLFDSENQMGDARRLADDDIVPIVINGDSSWTIIPSPPSTPALPAAVAERSLPPPPRSRSRSFTRKPIPAELSHVRVALSDGPVPGTPLARSDSIGRSPSLAHRQAASDAAAAARAARAAALRTGSYRHKKASDFNRSLKHKRSSTLRVAPASQLTSIPGSRPGSANDALGAPTTQAQRAAMRITTSTGLGSPRLYAQRNGPPKSSVVMGPVQPDKVATPPARPVSPRMRHSLPLPPLFSPLLRNNDSLA